MSQAKACHLLTRWFHARLILPPSRWRILVPPKRMLTYNGLDSVRSQKIELFITTAVRTSNPTLFEPLVSVSEHAVRASPKQSK
jgi:hypothetical protein